MIVGVYGEKDSGKTTLVESLVSRLIKKGYGVGTIKHIHYDDFSIDTEGRDTWKHKNSGASVVVSSAPNETAFIFKDGLEFDAILDHLDRFDLDVIIVEGYKKENIDKIMVGNGKEEPNTIFRYKDNLDEILEYIEDNVKKDGVVVRVNSKKIPLSKFPEDVVKNTVLGLISSLKGAEGLEDVEIRIRNK